MKYFIFAALLFIAAVLIQPIYQRVMPNTAGMPLMALLTPVSYLLFLLASVFIIIALIKRS